MFFTRVTPGCTEPLPLLASKFTPGSNRLSLPQECHRRQRQNQRYEPQETTSPLIPQPMIHRLRRQGQKRRKHILSKRHRCNGTSSIIRVRIRNVNTRRVDNHNTRKPGQHEADSRDNPVRLVNTPSIHE